MFEMKTLTMNGKTYDSFVDLDARNSIEEMAQNTVTEEQIASAVEDYMAEHPIETPDVVTDEQITNAVNQYLETHPVSGLTSTEKNLLLSLFRKTVYTDNMSATIAQLENLWAGSGGEEPDTPDEPDAPVVTKYTITKELVNVNSSNSASSVNEGASYTATLTADDGYEISNVTVLMGGVDVTASVYANGVITISSVTGNIEIIASAEIVEEESAELITDGLVDYFDFRNKETTAGTGGLYYLNSDIGGGQMYSWHNFGFDENGSKLNKNVNYTNNRSTGYPSAANTLSGDVSICYLAKSFAYMYDNGDRVLVAPNSFTHCFKYTNASGENVNGESKTLTAPDGYNCFTYVFSGAIARLYMNGVVYDELDCTDIEDFVSHKIDWRIATLDGDTYVAGMAVYDRALSEVEVVELGEYMKTLEVTA